MVYSATMPELIFRGNPHQQKGEFTFDALDVAERRLVTSLVNWQNPQRHNGHFSQIFGRSILYSNPSPEHLTVSSLPRTINA